MLKLPAILGCHDNINEITGISGWCQHPYPRGKNEMEKFQQALHDRSLSALDRLKVACYLWKNSHDPKSVLNWTCDQICSVDKKKSPDLYEELTTHLFKFLSVILRTPNVGEWCPIDSLFTAHFFNVSLSLYVLLYGMWITPFCGHFCPNEPLPISLRFDAIISLFHRLFLKLFSKSPLKNALRVWWVACNGLWLRHLFLLCSSNLK